MERIGLFGGSFNPVHLGHLLMARAALQELELSRLFFIPTAQSPFKLDVQLAPAKERVRLLRLALAGLDRTAIDDREITRGGVSYSIDTVREFAAEHPGRELWYLIGADHARLLPLWRSAAELAGLAQFAVMPRPGQSWGGLPEPFRGRLLRGWPLELSASEIRDRVKSGLNIDGLVPASVAEAIRNNELYL